MSLLNRLRPKWQNSDPDVRVDAVRQLDKNDIELLTAVAQHDTDARVRKIAINKLDTPKVLLELAENDNDESVRASALARARHLLVHIACDSRDAAESTRALELLTDSADVAAVAERAHFEDVRTRAFDALASDEALAALIQTAKSVSLRERALERISSPDVLKDVVLDERAAALAPLALNRIEDVPTLELIAEHGGIAKTLRRQAITKLSKLVPDDHPIKVNEREARFAGVAEELDDVETFVARPDALARLAEIEASWNELAAEGAPTPETSERFLATLTEIRERHEARRNAALAASEAEPAAAEPPTPEPTDAQPSDRPEHEIIDRVDRLSDAELAEGIGKAREAWAELDAKDARATSRFERVIEKAEKRLERLAKVESRKTELIALLDAAETSSLGNDADAAAKALSALTKKWRTFESIADAEQNARYAQLEQRARDLEEAKRHEQAALEQENLKKIQACQAKLSELIDARDLSIKEANKVLRQAQDLLKNMGPLAKSVNRKKIRRELSDARENLYKKTQDVRTVEDWKRWANADIQNSLIARIETLRESKDTPKVAKELRTIHDEWKKAGTAPPEKAEELWQRYKAVRDELKVRCDEFFEKQKKERLENLKAKEALCKEVEALADSDDWNKTADAIKAIQEKWKTIGPAPQKQSDAVWKRFRKSCDQFFDRRKGHFDELKGERDANLKQKEALCEQAEAIKESTDWKTTADTLKRLQSEWRTIGPVPRKKSDQVWKRFRAACDYFFDRFKRRDEVELEERVKQREAILARAQSLAAKSPDETSELATKTSELWASWKALGNLPESSRELFGRFDSLVGGLVAKAPDAFADTELDPKASAKKRERLVARLEGLSSSLGEKSSQEEATNDLEDLAKRLKDALASNTMTGGKPSTPNKAQAWRTSANEARKLMSSWLRSAPLPTDQAEPLTARFDAAYEKLLAQKPKS